MEQATGNGFPKDHWTTGAGHGRMTLVDGEVLLTLRGHQCKSPSWAKQLGLPLSTSEKSPYQISHPEPACGDDTDLSSWNRPLFRFIHFYVRANICSRGLHYRRLSVNRIDVVRESRGDIGKIAHQYIYRHSLSGRTRVHRCSDNRRGHSNRARSSHSNNS